MYFTLELNGERKWVKAPKKVSIGQVTEQAFGPQIEDARVVIVTKRRDVAAGMCCMSVPLFEEQLVNERRV